MKLKRLSLTSAGLLLLCLAACDPGPAEQSSVALSRRTQSTAPLPESGYRAALSLPNPPTRLRAGQRETLIVRVLNASDTNWPALGEREGDSRFVITLRNRWLNGANNSVANDMDGGHVIPEDVRPGEEVELPITITAPAQPGEYVLEFDMVQEQVTWFRDKGSEPLRLRVQVER